MISHRHVNQAKQRQTRLESPTTLIDTRKYHCPYLVQGKCHKRSNRCKLGPRCRRKHNEPCRPVAREMVAAHVPVAFRQRIEHFMGHTPDSALLKRLYKRTKDKECRICLETVVNKRPFASSLFGVLENCDHVFCLDCIKQWRSSDQTGRQATRTCPVCRVPSDLLIPSKYWFDCQEDKSTLIRKHKLVIYRSIHTTQRGQLRNDNLRPNTQGHTVYSRLDTARTPSTATRPQPPARSQIIQLQAVLPRPPAPLISRPAPPIQSSSHQQTTAPQFYHNPYSYFDDDSDRESSYHPQPHPRGSSSTNVSNGLNLILKMTAASLFLWAVYRI